MKYRIVESELENGKFCIERKHWLMGWERIQDPIPMTQENAHLYTGFGEHEIKWRDVIFDTVEEAEKRIIEWNTPRKKQEPPKVIVVKEITK